MSNTDIRALVSDEDYERVCMFEWRLMNTGYVATGGVENRTKKTAFNDFKQLHRFILGLPNGRKPEVDHINKVKHDDRRENLRIVTRAQNMWTSDNYKEYAPKGVTNLPNGKYRAMVRHEGKLIHLGVFTTIEEAYATRLEWEKKHWRFDADE